MKASKLLFAALLCPLLSASAGPEVDRMLDEYSKVKTVTCQIRRTKEGDLGKMKFLSRVYWTADHQLHAEGISPLKRRTIVDGRSLWQHAEGDPKGFSRPIDQLSDQMRISLEMVPGTAMDHLLRLKGMEESVLPADESGARRIAIQLEKQYVVMTIDAAGRLSSLQFFSSADMTTRLASYRYSDFSEAIAGVWVPMTHAIEMNGTNGSFQEIVKVDRFIANEPIAGSLFIASSFFDKDVDFVDDFAKIYPE